jgi:GNAT superfamily N-acetyltransferase
MENCATVSVSRVEITQAAPDRLSVLASVFGRAFVTEPMMRWSLGDLNCIEKRLIECFEYFLPPLLERGMVWEAGEATGAAVLIPPDKTDVWDEAQLRSGMRAVAEDENRYDAFWQWVESKIPAQPLWHLDSVGVEPAMQGRGIGSALIEFALALPGIREGGVFLETGTARNVPLYERFGFRVVESANAPDGGPRVWFMRRDP